MNLPELDVIRRTRKGNFLNQIDQLIDWAPIEKAIARDYAPASDAAGRPAYPGLLLFKMLLGVLGIFPPNIAIRSKGLVNLGL